MKISIANLSKSYGKVKAVNDLSLELEPGKVTALVGPNGAGKSTLLRLMAGREMPDSGDVTYNGASIFDEAEKLTGLIGLMPDSLPDSKFWRVAPYLDYYARGYLLKGDERRSKVKEVCDFMQINELLDRRLSDLSKGLKQRISLARILLGEPSVLLLDEPAAGLDPRARIELRDDIRKLATQGRNILISSHILTELEDMCDDVVILEQGRLRKHGNISALEIGLDGATTAANGDTASAQALAETAFTVELAEVTDAVKAQMAALPNFLRMEPAGRRSLVITVCGGRMEADDFMAALFASHLPVLSFSCKSKSLEGLFMESTSGAIQ